MPPRFLIAEAGLEHRLRPARGPEVGGVRACSLEGTVTKTRSGTGSGWAVACGTRAQIPASWGRTGAGPVGLERRPAGTAGSGRGRQAEACPRARLGGGGS